jgi:hypothetical protein
VGGLVNQGMRSCVDTLGRSAPAAMGVATCYGQEGQILRLNAKGIVQYKIIVETLVCFRKEPLLLFAWSMPFLLFLLFCENAQFEKV